MWLFIAYHFTHNFFLYWLVNVSVVCGFMSHDAGLDWEVWSLWVDWLIAFLNTTALIKYWANRCSKLRHSMADVLMLVVPGFGNDIHLAKDWIFIGLCFQEAISNHSTLKQYFAYFLAIASILSLFLPLPEHLKSEEDAQSFISSHWPIIMALPAVDKVEEVKAKPRPIETKSSRLHTAYDAIQVQLQAFFMTKINAQTTKAKQVVAEQN